MQNPERFPHCKVTKFYSISHHNESKKNEIDVLFSNFAYKIEIWVKMYVSCSTLFQIQFLPILLYHTVHKGTNPLIFVIAMQFSTKLH